MNNFNIELTPTGSLNGKIQASDAYDAGMTALAYIESISFLLGRIETEEIERIHVQGVSELTMKLCGAVAGCLNILNEARVK